MLGGHEQARFSILAKMKYHASVTLMGNFWPEHTLASDSEVRLFDVIVVEEFGTCSGKGYSSISRT
jgi:hypothetical protein